MRVILTQDVYGRIKNEYSFFKLRYDDNGNGLSTEFPIDIDVEFLNSPEQNKGYYRRVYVDKRIEDEV